MQIPGILLQLARNNPKMQQIQKTIDIIKAAQNPQAVMNQLVASNPNLKQVMDIVNEYGGDANKAFQETAAKMGVDPQEIMKLFS